MDSLFLCRNLLDEIMNNPDAEPFMTPVPWKEWNLFDYPEIVKNPMDLSTVKQKLTDNKYPDAYAFAEDMRLIWSNCILYNPEGTEVRAAGEHFSTLFEEKWKALLNKLPENCKIPSKEKKTQFAENFSRLSSEQIEHIVTTLQEQCPKALSQGEEGQLDIVIDSISVGAFYPLFQYQLDCLS